MSVNDLGNHDPNRHRPTLDAVRPLPDNQSRHYVGIYTQQYIDEQCRAIALVLRTASLDPAIEQFKANYNNNVNLWVGASNRLDRGIVSNFTKWSSLIAVFILDTMAFTFTFYGLFETLLESQRAGVNKNMLPPIDQTMLIVSAAFVASFVTIAIKKLAEGSVKDKSNKATIAYFVTWTLFAIADFYYLASHGVVGVGVIATGLLIAMCAITKVHAHHNPDDGSKALEGWDSGHTQTYWYNQRLEAAYEYAANWQQISGQPPQLSFVRALLTNFQVVDAAVLVQLGFGHIAPQTQTVYTAPPQSGASGAYGTPVVGSASNPTGATSPNPSPTTDSTAEPLPTSDDIVYDPSQVSVPSQPSVANRVEPTLSGANQPATRIVPTTANQAHPSVESARDEIQGETKPVQQPQRVGDSSKPTVVPIPESSIVPENIGVNPKHGVEQPEALTASQQQGSSDTSKPTESPTNAPTKSPEDTLIGSTSDETQGETKSVHQPQGVGDSSNQASGPRPTSTTRQEDVAVNPKHGVEQPEVRTASQPQGLSHTSKPTEIPTIAPTASPEATMVGSTSGVTDSLARPATHSHDSADTAKNTVISKSDSTTKSEDIGVKPTVDSVDAEPSVSNFQETSSSETTPRNDTDTIER
jgi:hypothetical protein